MQLIRRLQNLPMPVVCAVNGVAAGSGVNIALACDIVLAARSANFIQPFCKLGLIPDAGGSWFLPHKIGRSRALGLAMLGDKLSADKAEQWGLIWQAVEDEHLAERARSLVLQLSTQPTIGLARIRKAIDAAIDNSLDEQLDLERDMQREAGQSADYREGVAAFMEKRSPEFTGN